MPTKQDAAFRPGEVPQIAKSRSVDQLAVCEEKQHAAIVGAPLFLLDQSRSRDPVRVARCGSISGA
jgi:hypothetical protein